MPGTPDTVLTLTLLSDRVLEQRWSSTKFGNSNLGDRDPDRGQGMVCTSVRDVHISSNVAGTRDTALTLTLSDCVLL